MHNGNTRRRKEGKEAIFQALMTDFPQINVTHQTTIQETQRTQENVTKKLNPGISYSNFRKSQTFKCHLVIAPKDFLSVSKDRYLILSGIRRWSKVVLFHLGL